jgi:predicted nucleic acid-binding protein
MPTALVDSNVLLDFLAGDGEWFDWSADVLEDAAERGTVCINPVIYGEVSLGFDTLEDLDDALPADYFVRSALPWEAAFLAAKVFRQYRRHGGSRSSTLPDFFIGAHAAVSRMTLLTRDARRYRTYFPRLSIIAP